MKLDSLNKSSTFAGYIKQLISETMELCEEGKEYTVEVDYVQHLNIHPKQELSIQEHAS